MIKNTSIVVIYNEFNDENTTRATSAPQRVQSSPDFLKSLLRYFEKVTYRLLSLLIFFISIIWRPQPFFPLDMTDAQTERTKKRKEKGG